MNLPKFQTADAILSMMQTKWASILNPLLSNPCNQSSILPSVSLKSGANIVNHKLGQKLQGWNIVRQRANATIFDTQDSNQTPEITLQLTASGAVVVDIEVF